MLDERGSVHILCSFLLPFCCIGVSLFFVCLRLVGIFTTCAGYATGARRVGWVASSSTLSFCLFDLVLGPRQRARARGGWRLWSVRDSWKRGPRMGPLVQGPLMR